MRLVIDKVGKVYTDASGHATTALEDISLTIDEEEFVALVGPSGCGKSTLLSMVAGLTTITTGDIYFDGMAANSGPRIGVVFQEHALFPWRTVRKNVEFGLENLGYNRSDRAEKALQLIRMVGLEGFEDKYPHQLSGGMRQRVGIARALAVDPDLLLMDEPLSALDAQVRQILQDELLRIWTQLRQKTLYVTHNIGEAVALADRVVVLSRRPGRIVETVSIDLPKLERQDPKYQARTAELTGHIWSLIRADAERAFVEG